MINTDQIRSLVEKYRKPGPRYTSYPSALHFRAYENSDSLWMGTRQDSGPLSLYVHIPFCEKRCWFCGCHTLITRNHDRADDYLDLLEREIELSLPDIDSGRQVAQVHLGGGTPNFLSPSQIERLGSILSSRFQFELEVEFGVELAPAHLDPSQIQAFRRIGVNRASFGIQDCNPEVQKAIHRIQPKEMNFQTMEWLREAGIQSVNIDLIYGLPLQTVGSFQDTIQHSLELEPDRIALFGYAHVPWVKPAQKILERSRMPDGAERLDILLMSLERLTGSGYRYIGMDHFARDDDELAQAQIAGSLYRNFQGYSTRAGCEIVAFGISAISQNSQGFRQNHKSMLEYRKALGAGQRPVERGYLLNDEDRLRAAVIQAIMCRLEVAFAPFEREFGIVFRDHFAEALTALEEMAQDRLITWSDSGFLITPLGRLFIRNIAMAFDAYLRPEKQAYSKTV